MSEVNGQKSKIILGIDFGGTKTRFALVKDGRILKFKEERTAASSNLFVDRARSFLGKEKISGIGIGIAGVVDSKNGIIVHSANMKRFNGLKIAKIFSNAFKVPTRIDNDAHCFLRAETKSGAARGKGNVLGITLGTGIGGAIMLNGALYEGSHFSAGEVGHMRFSEKMEWEDVAGKKFFTKLSQSPWDVAVSARRGSNKDKETFRSVGNYLGLGIANLVNILDPELVIIGGGGSKYTDLFLPEAKKTAARFIINPYCQKIPIVAAKLGDKAGVIGAALLFGN